MASCSNWKHVLSARKSKNKKNNLVINQEVAIINVHRFYLRYLSSQTHIKHITYRLIEASSPDRLLS